MPSERRVKPLVLRVAKHWAGLFAKHDILNHASAIAFQVLKALIPLTLLGLALLGVLGLEDVWYKTISPGIGPHLQPATHHAIDVAVGKIFSSNAATLIALSSLLTIWYVSGSVRAVMSGMNQIYDAKETRSLPLRYAISVALAIAIVVCVIGAVLVIATAPRASSSGVLHVILLIARWPVAVVALGLAVGLLVRYAPVEARSKRWTSAGSALVIAAWIADSSIFKLYVSSVANFKSATGSLTVFIVLTAYVYTSSIIFLVGVQVDELLRKARSRRNAFDVLLGVGGY